MNKLINKGKIYTTVSLMLWLAGCASVKNVEDAANQNYNLVNKTLESMNKPKDDHYISYSNDFYLSNDTFEVQHAKQLPPALKQKFQYQGLIKNFSDITAAVISTTGLNVTISTNAKEIIDKIKPLAIRYEGDISGFLDYIASVYGISWKYSDKLNGISFFYYEQKIFQLNVLSGDIENKSSLQSVGQSESANNTANIMTTYSSGENNQWDQAIAAIKLIINTNGYIQADPVSGYVVVVTTPDLMENVSSYINSINDSSQKRIAIRVDIYDVTKAFSSNYGLDINALYKTTSASINWITGNMMTPLSNVADESASISGTINSGVFKGTEFLLNTLQHMGKLTHITGSTIYTVNNRPAPLQVSTTQNYIKQITVTQTGDNDDDTQTSVTPGSLQTGYSVMVTPKITSTNKILVNVTVNLSSVISIQTRTFGKDSSNQNSVDLPTTRSKSFMQAVPLASGQTAVIAGFQDNQNDVASNSHAAESSWWLGGAKATQSNNAMTVVLVTPYIINS